MSKPREVFGSEILSSRAFDRRGSRVAGLTCQSIACLVLAAFALFPRIGTSQTRTITNGVQTYFALTNTTVTMTGRCELRVTATNNPIAGSTIHLNSPNAWFLLPNIPPSVAMGYLGQLRVNGVSATSGSNVRVDPFGMGTVVVPHAPSLRPLQVFSGQNFLGASSTFGIYTYYTGPGLGTMNGAIRSFILKRGYMATFAQAENGAGSSQVFVAQDADLEIGVLSSDLDRAVHFVRVFPWRWTNKKGWAGGVQSLVNPHWNYDWDNVATSTANVEYVPMRHNANWNAYANINNKQRSTHALGFNEPDKAEQANMTVSAAIAQWPNLLASGLRLGAPAVSDSGVAGEGLDWLYSFMDQANARNYRVDFVPVHFYKCDWTVTQFYNWLLGIYQRTDRPVWVTEFNNGANWCSSTPTLDQNATKISQFIDMLETTPFVERYAIYNWVGANRAMVADNGTLTQAGVIYRDKQSSLAYRQTLPTGRRSIVQYQFDGNTLDGSGYGNNGLALGIPSYASGQVGEAIVLDGTNNLIRLPPNVANSAEFSFAAWVYWDGGGNWQRIFDFGDDTSHYLFLTPSSGSGTLRFAIRNGGSEQMVETTALPVAQWRHVAVTLSGSTCRLYTNGTLAASSGSFTITPSQFNPALNYLGESQFTADPLFRGRLDELFIADYAFTPAQIAALRTNLPPYFVSNIIVRANANPGQIYSDTLAADAIDANPEDILSFSKADGPNWLTIAPNGVLSGTPADRDGGANSFTVRVTDSAGASAFAMLIIQVNVLLNPSFEVPITTSYIYNPAGAAWTFSAGGSRTGSGVAANGSGFTGGNAAAPDGNQVAFLQATGTISQAVSGFSPGTNYTLTFKASQRQNRVGGQLGQTFDLKVDDAVIGSFEPDQANPTYAEFATNFTATAVTHALTFAGTDRHGGDNTLLLDDVRIILTPPPQPAAPTDLTGSPANRQVALQWNAPARALSYNVKRSSDIGADYDIVASGVATTNYNDTTVSNGVTYYYAVSGVNDAGEGPDSTAIALTPGYPVSPKLISKGAVWRYFDKTTDPGASWRSNSFNDVTWSNGLARLGYGNDGEVTKVASNRQWTTYFRRQFYVSNPAYVSALNAQLTRDDAAVIYLNGAEVWRDTNITSGTINYTTPALVALGGADETNWLTKALNPSGLIAGWNTLAAEVHNQSLTSTDLGFDFELTAQAVIVASPSATLTNFAGSLAVKWPPEASYFAVYSATNLTPPVAWTPVTNTPVLVNGLWTLRLPSITDRSKFFRLQAE